MKTLFLFAIVLMVSVYADGCNFVHNCVKPTIIHEVFELEYDDKYKEQVLEYKECIQKFVHEQNDAIKKHTKAKKEAIKEWNNFVIDN